MAPRTARVLCRLAVATLLCAGCGVTAPGPSAPAAVDVAGTWAGNLQQPGGPLAVGVTLTGAPGALSGTLDIPAESVRATPLADVSADGGTVVFTAPELPGDVSFAGTLAADGSAIGGSFTQDGATFPLVLRRAG